MTNSTRMKLKLCRQSHECQQDSEDAPAEYKTPLPAAIELDDACLDPAVAILGYDCIASISPRRSPGVLNDVVSVVVVTNHFDSMIHIIPSESCGTT